MKINKKESIILLTLTLIITLMSFVSAQDIFTQAEKGVNDMFKLIESFFGPLFAGVLGVSQFDEFFFARVLFFIIVFMMSYYGLTNVEVFKKNKGASIILALVVAVLGARYIAGIDLIQQIMLPYGALTIALSVILPFLVFFYFVHNTMTSGVARRAAWVFFAVIFVGLWWTRRKTEEFANNPYSWIYTVGIVAVIAVIAFDEKIHEYFGILEASNAKRDRIKRQIADIEVELNKYQGIANPSLHVKDMIRHLEDRRMELTRSL